MKSALALLVFGGIVILTIVFAYFTYANTVYFSLVLTSFADA